MCEFCGLQMGPASGIPRTQRLQFHILRRCPKYVPAAPTTPPVAVPSQPTTHAGSTPASSSIGQSVVARMPKPVQCKKKAGTCNHVDAFGKHYDKKLWAVYKKNVDSQHATTEVPTE